MANTDSSLYGYDVGFYECSGVIVPGKMLPDGFYTVSKKAVDAARDVEIDPSDVLSATYPKTGQTWTLTIIRLIRQAKDLEAGMDISLDDYYDQNPFMETEGPNGVTGTDKFYKLQPPRIMKTHMPFQFWKNHLEKHPNLRVIQTMRNPKDTLVSWYHQMRSDNHLGGFNGTWDQYFEEFKNKRLLWGDYFEVNADWYKFNKGRDNSLILKYEEMKKDPKTHVIKIAKFLGHDLSDRAIDLIVENCAVEKVGKKFNDLFKTFPQWNQNRSQFVRKGQVGDFVTLFSKEQSDYVDAMCKQYLEPLGLTFEYSIDK